MTRMRWFVKTTVAAAVLLIPVVASAHGYGSPGSGLYVGAGGGRADNRGAGSQFPGPFVNIDRTRPSWKAYVGLAFNRYFAIQGGYQDFGTDTVSTAIGSETIRNRGYDLNGVLSFPFTSQVAVFIEGGASRFRTRTISPIATTVTHEGTHPDYGAGVQFFFLRHVALRGQWQEFRIPNNNTQVYSGSLLFQF
ncbi:MAG: outer membrane beta-barrel protein [Acidiferrobacter sp.]